MIWIEKTFAFIRAVIMSVLFIVQTSILGLVTILCNIIFNKKKIEDAIIQFWGRLTCAMFGVRLDVRDLANLPENGSVVLFNHSSFFDIFALAAAIPGLRFGAKIELFKIPIFGLAMRRTGTLPIARESREEVFKVYDEAKGRFMNGAKFALAPEGKRYYGPQLAPFKAGPFVFALSAHAPLTPVVIKGAYECLAKGQILANKDKWSRTIRVTVLPQIPTVAYSIETRGALQKVAYQQMNSLWTSDL